MPPARTSPRRRSLAEGIVDILTTRIRSGDLAPGTRLPTEPEMTAEHGVSRTVVREAISRLQAAGLVETRHGIGTFVLEPSPRSRLDAGVVLTIRDVLAMLELRISLETEAAALAARRRDADDLVAMRAALDDFASDAGLGQSGVEADFRFHMSIAKATRNRWFETIFHDLGTTTLPRTRLDLRALPGDFGPDYLRRTNLEHEAVLSAIQRGDAEAARAAMRMHLTNSRERLKRIDEAVSAELTGPV
jgi:DNA-binding FadR family transcriptional regulator